MLADPLRPWVAQAPSCSKATETERLVILGLQPPRVRWERELWFLARNGEGWDMIFEDGPPFEPTFAQLFDLIAAAPDEQIERLLAQPEK